MPKCKLVRIYAEKKKKKKRKKRKEKDKEKVFRFDLNVKYEVYGR